MSRIHYTHCPVCNSSHIDPLLRVKDHSVSQEEFVVWQCRQCTLRFTQDVPDESSIGPYYQSPDYISHTNTSQGVLNSLYQKVRRYTLRQKAALLIRHTKQRGKLLDIGAGVGAFLSEMKEQGWEVNGIEPDEGARSKARELFGLQLSGPDAFFTENKGQYDAITLWHVLEHVHQLHSYVDRIKELLAVEGKLFVAVPNYTSADAEAYRNYWAAYDVPRHLYHFTPASVDVLMNEHGLKITAIKPMWFDSFYISLLSSKYHRGKTSWIGAGINGLKSNIATLFQKDRCSSLIYIIEKR